MPESDNTVRNTVVYVLGIINGHCLWSVSGHTVDNRYLELSLIRTIFFLERYYTIYSVR